jgi:O-antigen/teichoic acid export membrane protein
MTSSKSARRQHIANVIVAQVNTAVGMAGSFVVTPAILYGLGDARYGGWLLINSFVSYTRFLDLGTSSGAVKYGAGAEKRGDMEDFQRVLDTATALFLGIAFLTMLATGALTVLLPHLYPTVAGDEALTILVLGCSMVVDACARPFATTLRMRSLYFITDAFEIVSYSIFKLGLLLYLAYSGRLSLRVLAILTLCDSGLRILFAATAALTINPAVRKINPFRAHRAMVRKIATMGVAVTIMLLADIIRFQIDAAVIGFFKPDSPISISIFGVGTRLPSIANTAIGVIGAVLIPRLSGLSEVGDKKGAMDLVREGSQTTGFVASFVLVNIAVLGPGFLALWLKKPWVAESGRLLLVMLPGYYIALLTGPAAGLLVGEGKMRGLTLLTVVEALTNLALSIALIFRLGILGVALGTVIPLGFFRGVVFPLLLKREIGLRPIDYLRMHAPAIGIGLAYLVLTGGLALVPMTSYGRFILLGGLSTLVFAVLLMATVPVVRTAVTKRLRRKSASDKKAANT